MHGMGIFVKKEYRHKSRPNQEIQIGQWQYGLPTMSFIRNDRNSIRRERNLKKHTMLKVLSDGSFLRETIQEDGQSYATVLYKNGDIYKGLLRKRTQTYQIINSNYNSRQENQQEHQFEILKEGQGTMVFAETGAQYEGTWLND